MATQNEVDGMYLCRRFDDWATDWTLPILYLMLLSGLGYKAWLLSFVVAIFMRKISWYVYPVALWSPVGTDILISLIRMGLGGYTAYIFWEDQRGQAVMCLLMCVPYIGSMITVLMYNMLAMTIADRPMVRKYRKVPHRIFAERYLGYPPEGR